MHDAGNPTARLLAKLLRELLAEEDYTQLADLVADLKTRAGRLRIRWSPDAVAEALRLVESNANLVAKMGPANDRRTTGERPLDQTILTREQAAQFLRRLQDRNAATPPPERRREPTMKFWVYSTRARSCGRCNRPIGSGEIALKLTLDAAPGAELWRCTDCVGPPPPDVIEVAATINTDAAARRASLGERLDAITRRLTARRRNDWKSKQAGEEG